MTSLFADFSFRYPFRKYQRMILEQTEQAMQDRKFHIVAPPGAGKTIIGLELIRRFEAPAVVFAPTTTIQYQWYQKVGMFLPRALTFLFMPPWKRSVKRPFTSLPIS